MFDGCDPISISAPTNGVIQVSLHTETVAANGADALRARAHALLRRALSQHAPQIAPERWRWVADAQGKPTLAGPANAPPLAFNVTHTDGLVACVVCDCGRVGIDAERLDRPARFAALARQLFTRREYENWCALPAADQPRHFLTLWTLKEAYVKALGHGVTLPLRTPEFLLGSSDAAELEAHDSAGANRRGWTFARTTTGSGHLLAVAVDHSSAT